MESGTMLTPRRNPLYWRLRGGWNLCRSINAVSPTHYPLPSCAPSDASNFTLVLQWLPCQMPGLLPSQSRSSGLLSQYDWLTKQFDPQLLQLLRVAICITVYIDLHCLVGLVVKRPPQERKILGLNPAGIFLGSSHTSDLKIGTPVATLPYAWCYRVSAGTGWPGVSILCDCETCCAYTSVQVNRSLLMAT